MLSRDFRDKLLVLVFLDKLKNFGGGGGPTIEVNIENVFGTDPDEIADALQIKLQNMVAV